MTANATGAAVVGASKVGAVIAKFTPRGSSGLVARLPELATRGSSRNFSQVCMDGDGRLWVAGQARLPAVPDAQ